MNATRLMWLNGLLFLVILAVSVLVIMQERTLPGEPPVKQAKREVTRLIGANSDTELAVGGDLVALDKQDIFQTIIPLPTPTVAPTKTPQPPPRIEEVTEYWKLSFVMGSRAQFQNIKSEKDFMIEVGESFAENYRGQNYNVYLESVDKSKWSATIMMNEMGEIQRRSFSMFE